MEQTPYRTVLQRMQHGPALPVAAPAQDAPAVPPSPTRVTRVEWGLGVIIVLQLAQLLATVLCGGGQ
jgi:hypothetical protein